MNSHSGKLWLFFLSCKPYEFVNGLFNAELALAMQFVLELLFQDDPVDIIRYGFEFVLLELWFF